MLADQQNTQANGPRTTMHILGRYDAWGCFDSFGEPMNCTYDDAVAACKSINEGREPWMKFGVHRPPIEIIEKSYLQMMQNLETVSIRRCYKADIETIEKCKDIAIRCLREHGFKIKAAQLFHDLASLADDDPSTVSF
jgi:hypothetical protein